MIRRLSFLLILLAWPCCFAFADQISLKNGDRLTGTVIKADEKDLILDSELLGKVTIPLGSVAAISVDKPLYVTMADGRTIRGLLTTTGAQAEIRSTGLADISVDRTTISVLRSDSEQRSYEKSLNPGLLEQWTGGADFGASLTSGNSDTINLTLGLALSRTTARDKTTAYVAAIYNHDRPGGESRTVADTIRGGLRYERDINRKWFGYGSTGWEHNGLQGLTLRLVLGGGVGAHLIRNERTQLDVLGGLGWNRESFKGNFNDRNSAEAQVGQTLSLQLNSRLSLKQQMFIFPNLSAGGEYRINFDGAVVTDISRRIAWQATLSDRYISNPPNGFQKNDLILTTGLKVKLGGIRK